MLLLKCFKNERRKIKYGENTKEKNQKICMYRLKKAKKNSLEKVFSCKQKKTEKIIPKSCLHFKL